MNKHSPKKKQERLQRLGLTEEHQQNYLTLFCNTRIIDKYGFYNGNNWEERKGRWWQGLILQHLLGEKMVALFPSMQIDTLIFDIDNHDPDRNGPVGDRCQRIIDCFDTDPLIYTSSDSGGLRVCYFLDQPYFREDVLQFAADRVEKHGLKIRDGVIEIMATKRMDRLPFGQGSHLVERPTFDPIYDMSISDMIEFAWTVREYEKLTITGLQSHRAVKRLNKRDFGDLVDYLEENGLPARMSTNEALLLLNRKLMGVEGRSGEDAARWLKAWIRANHNGNSNSVNAGEWEKVDDHIDRIVSYFDPAKYNFRALKSVPMTQRLTLGDVRVILSVLPKYKQQLAAFSLLKWVKNKGKLLNTSEIEESLTPFPPHFTCNLYVVGFLQNWECEIPYEAFKRFPGFDKTHPIKTREELENSGLLKLHKREDQQLHRCRSYKVFFTFDEYSSEVVSLDEALLLLKSQSELKADYGSYMTKQIEAIGDKLVR